MLTNQQRTVGLLLDGGKLLLVDLEVHRNGSGLDGDTTLLLVLSRISETHVTSFCGGNDTGF